MKLPVIVLVFAVVALSGCAASRADRNVDGEQAFDAGDPRFVTWGDRRVAWMERGDKDGFPIFYAHGNPGSRLELLFLDRKAREYGFRVIAFDRPGLGQSDYQHDYGLLDFASDVERLADELGIDSFGLIGWSSGGPPVLAAASQMPQRAAFAISISGYTNFGEYPQARELMSEYQLRGPELSRNMPALFGRAVELVRWVDLELPNFYLKMAEAEMSDADRVILNDQQRAGLFVRNQQESLAQGTEGAIQDLEVQWAPWPLSLGEIQVPVYLFQGQRDTFVPWPFATHMAKAIPAATLTLLPDQGHLFFLAPEFQDQILSVALKHIDD